MLNEGSPRVQVLPSINAPEEEVLDISAHTWLNTRDSCP